MRNREQPMPYELTDKLVIGLSSSALFDLTESDNIFKEQGEADYRQYQRENQNNPLSEGVAFPFIRRLLNLNQLRPDNPLVEVILLSRNDPDTGLRVMNSIEHHQLNITRAVFLQGSPPYKYIPAFNISLFLSADPSDVKQAIIAGYPAGQILSGKIEDDIDDKELRIAFDFDGVLIDDEAEKIYQQHDLQQFQDYETEHVNLPHNKGVLQNFLHKISNIQKIEQEISQQNSAYQPVLKVAIVTARNAPSHKRAINTLRAWNISVNQAFFLGGIDKSLVLNVLQPHIFFDDQKRHLSSSDRIASVHIPFGIANA